ncbi:MAG: AlbA family DNA-binding domain-containing protein [Planctomycetota bacterium]|jgi:hypothetical protein
MQDWDAIIGLGFESKDFDYKGPCSWDPSDKASCCGLVKDVLAMANTKGGHIVIGVEETETGYNFKGLTDEQMASFDTTKVNQFVQRYAEPPINVTVHKELFEGKNYIIVSVPHFPSTPHVCKKEFPDVLKPVTIYVRTANNESAPIQSVSDYQSLIETAVRNRADQLLSSIRTIITGNTISGTKTDTELFLAQYAEAGTEATKANPHSQKKYGSKITTFFPGSFTKDRFDLGQLHSMASNGHNSFRGWPYLLYHKPETSAIHDGIQLVTGSKTVLGQDYFQYWQLRQSGLLYARDALWTDTYRRAKDLPDMLDFDSFSMTAAEAIYCLTKVYENQLDDDEEVVFKLSLTKMQDRILGSSNLSRSMDNWVCRIPQIDYEKRMAFAEWKAGLIDHALELCRFVFQRFNWEHPNTNESRKLMEKMFQRRL